MLTSAAAAPPDPITIDDPALLRLAAEGYRFTEGQTGLVRYRWLLPPGWVAAAELLPGGRGPIEPLLGVGDRGGEATAALGVLRGHHDSPRMLLERRAAPDALIRVFRSRDGEVAERIERRQGGLAVTTAHAFSAGGEPYRFLIAALARQDGDAVRTLLRTVATGLSLRDGLVGLRAGRLHG